MTYTINPVKKAKTIIEGQEVPPRFELRWRFEFANKPTRAGMWSQPAKMQSDMAAFVNKDGLISASIEAKNFYTQEQFIIAECSGQDFVNFKWVAERHQVVAGPGLYSFANWHNLVGLSLVTRDVELTVYFDGNNLILNRTEEDKNFHYECFGR
jgi:hypothetical protein